jgi:hypothetical protein
MDEELAPGRGSDPVTEIPEIGILFATLPELSFLSPVVGILDGLLVVRGEDEGGTGLADAADFGEGATALIAAGDVHEAIEAEDGGIEPVAVKGQASHVGHPESPGGPAGLTQFPGPLHHFRGEVHPNAGGGTALLQAEGDPAGAAAELEDVPGRAEPVAKHGLFGSPEAQFLGGLGVVLDDPLTGVIPADLPPFHTPAVEGRAIAAATLLPRQGHRRRLTGDG